MRQLREDLIDFFNGDFLSISSAGPLKVDPKKVFLKRTKNHEIELEVVFAGVQDNAPEDIAMGTIFDSNISIDFTNPAGFRYIASGLIELSKNINSSEGETHTIYHYSVNKMEMQAPNEDVPAYVIEWVGNLSKRLIGNSSLRSIDKEESILEFGKDLPLLSMKKTSEFNGFCRIMNVKISDNDIFIVPSRETQLQKDLRCGYIIYNSNIKSDERRKIRECISFVMGLPIVLFGHTKYNTEGEPIYMRSIPARSFGGKAFELNDMPPYPIASGKFSNIPNIVLLECAISKLYQSYDRLKFGELCWTYWHGTCAPTTMSAVYFGGLCEQLQRIMKRASGLESGTLICNKKWRLIEKSFRDAIDQAEIDPMTRKIFQNKINSLNQLPQNVELNRLLQHLGLSISEAERGAWRHRNSAAHGSIHGTYEEIILNSKLLKLLFHRLLAAITNCSESYIDYYSFNFPIRQLAEEIPQR